MLRPLLAVLAAVTVTALALTTGGGVRTAHAAGRAELVATPAMAPGYALEGFRWQGRTQLEIYYVWDGGPCILDGVDYSGPASTLDPAIALEVLDESIADINLQLRGGLTLVNAGPTTRADLCSTASGQPIVVGFGALVSTGLTRYAGITLPGATVTSFTSARVLLKNTYDFTCPTGATYRDLQHVFTHELLHALGIDHSADPTAIMAPTGNACASESLLQPDDVAGLAALYPPVLPPPTSAPAPAPVEVSGGFDRSISATGVNTALWSGGSLTALAAATLGAGGVSVTVFAGGDALVYVP
ncbi:MAG: matrixin family metalloprotease [Chloroflexi bacterium]|nr:matrixin family metalloprotease [Chloroflexota bacterium]